MRFDGDLLKGVVQGLQSCPICESDNWKSARMVVLEGTSNYQGHSSESMKELFLSDWWFGPTGSSSLGSEVTVMSGLISEVRKLMLAHSSFLTIRQRPEGPPTPAQFVSPRPIPPVRPKKPQDQQLAPPLVPNLPARPCAPTPPVPPKKRSWKQHAKGIWNALVGSMFLSGVMVVIWSIWFGVTLFGILVVFGVTFLLLFSAYLDEPKDEYKTAVKQYEKAEKRHEKAMRQYAADGRKYQQAKLKYDRDLKEYESQPHRTRIEQEEYERLMKQFEAASERYERECADAAERDALVYKSAKIRYEKEALECKEEEQRVLKMRELMWERARICVRCGNGYIGEIGR